MEELKNEFDGFISHDNDIFVYLRVSTIKQSVEGQLLEVLNYCKKNRVYPPYKNIFIDEAISGAKDWQKRKLNEIVDMAKKGDTIIVPELSRLGRDMMSINGLINDLVNVKKITIIDIKNNLKLDGSFQSSIMSVIMNICSQMERELIRTRVKSGMKTDACKEKMKNRKPRFKNKLDGKEEDIKKMLKEDVSKPDISKSLGVHLAQLHKFIKDKNIFI